MLWLEESRTLPIGDYHLQFQAAFLRPNIKAESLHALRQRKGWKTGRSGHFAKGQEPANKGKPCAPGTGGRHPNAVATQFRKGSRAGVAVKLYKPIGTERLSKEGYRERKIHDGMPLQSRWRAIHLIEWEAKHGPIPAGHCLKCLGDDRGNTAPSNWVMISRAMLPALNGGTRKQRPAFDSASPELKPTLLALAKAETQVREIRRKKAAP